MGKNFHQLSNFDSVGTMVGRAMFDLRCNLSELSILNYFSILALVGVEPFFLHPVIVIAFGKLKAIFFIQLSK